MGLPAKAFGQVKQFQATEVIFPFPGDKTAQQPKFTGVGGGLPVGQKTQLPETVVHIFLPAIEAPEGLALAVGVLPVLVPEIDPGAKQAVKAGGTHDDGFGSMEVADTAAGSGIKQRPEAIFHRPVALGIDFSGIAAEHEIAVGLIPTVVTGIDSLVVEPPEDGKA